MLDSMKTSRNGSQNKHKKIFSRYMQEKLAVTVLVITLALFGLAVKLYMLVDEKNEEYTEIVLNQQSSYNSRTRLPAGGHCGPERHLPGHQRKGLQSDPGSQPDQ